MQFEATLLQFVHDARHHSLYKMYLTGRQRIPNGAGRSGPSTNTSIMYCTIYVYKYRTREYRTIYDTDYRVKFKVHGLLRFVADT